MNESHKVSFRGVRYLRGSGVYEEFWFKEGLVLVVVVSLVGIGWSRQFVCWRVDLARDVFDDEVVFLEVGVPSCRSSVQFLWSFPVLQVGVVGEDGEWGFRPS